MLSPNASYMGYLLSNVELPDEVSVQWGCNVGGFGGNVGRIHAPGCGQAPVHGQVLQVRGLVHAPGQAQGPDGEEVPDHMRADGWSELEIGSFFYEND